MECRRNPNRQLKSTKRMDFMATPILFTWNLTPSRLSALREISAPLGVPVRPVAPQEAAKPLASLGETVPAPGLAAMPFAEEMLLMVYFPDKLIDRLLAGMKAKGMAILRKAVLTPTNAGWNSVQLFAELSREAARFKP